MSLQRFKVLTFDVVGTLIDFERGMLDYLRAVAPEARPDYHFRTLAELAELADAVDAGR